MTAYRELGRAELLRELRERFGDDPMSWTFRCPNCGIDTSGQQMAEALHRYPMYNNDGGVASTSDILGRFCIGRVDASQGCDWVAFGMFRGPWKITTDDGGYVWGFAISPTA